MTSPGDPDAPDQGLRERKRRETTQRITDAGLNLFLAKGYQATTLDEIAVAAGISRRTFFHYFKSKDDILLSLQAGLGAMLVEAVRDAPPDGRPVEVLRDAIVKVCAAIPKQDMIAIDRLMRSSEAVQARKQASYVETEKALFAALQKRSPEPGRETRLRLVAMAAVGAMRLATEAFNREGGTRPLEDLVREAFDALGDEI